MKYNFDEIIDRKNTNSMNTDGFREFMFKGRENLSFAYKDDELIRMWIADMDFATPPEIIEAIRTRLDQRIFGYSQVFDPNYYVALSNWTERMYDWTFPKEYLVTSPGIIPALYELCEYICKPDEKVLIVTPSYAFFKSAVEFNHLELVCSKLKNENGHYTINYDDLEAKAKDPKVVLCIFCNPHNPTGRLWKEEELRRVGEICLRNHVWIISDEIHCDLLRSGLSHTPFAKLFPQSDRIVTCMAPSKTFNMAGLMFSNVIIPNQELRELWLRRHYSFKNPLSIAATQAAYEHGQQWHQELLQYLDGNFKFTDAFLSQYLPEAQFKIPEATYLAWINISNYIPGEEDLTGLLAAHAGVLLEDGSMFVDNGQGYIRLNLACPRAVLKEGLQRIAAFLNSYRDPSLAGTAAAT
ncbi:aminotransferase [Paenibacillus yonginensis]|uniref:cysteine-S-conjugate beta-lyase n=1 Tax=Paenibacillus yonginensis TaxID=1462996 RepID=A0A1B1MZB8_9BACL|nr:MalY/PatB family protein [Paenibacillus yonginensis]ANS74525.1 aminotransferase [Paenibacillus yonginensis]